MLKIWRGKNMIFAECTTCGSYGTAGHLQPKLKLEPDIQEALDRHTAHMLTLRGHYTKAANEVVRQIQTNRLSRREGMEKVRTLWETHVAQVRLAEAALPSPDGKVTEVVTNCPWCDAPSPEVEVEILPEEQAYPDFSLAVKKTPISPEGV